MLFGYLPRFTIAIYDQSIRSLKHINIVSIDYITTSTLRYNLEYTFIASRPWGIFSISNFIIFYLIELTQILYFRLLFRQIDHNQAHNNWLYTFQDSSIIQTKFNWSHSTGITSHTNSHKQLVLIHSHQPSLPVRLQIVVINSQRQLTKYTIYIDMIMATNCICSSRTTNSRQEWKLRERRANNHLDF